MEKQHTPEHEKDKVKLEVFGLWQTEIYIPPPVKDVSGCELTHFCS